MWVIFSELLCEFVQAEDPRVASGERGSRSLGASWPGQRALLGMHRGGRGPVSITRWDGCDGGLWLSPFPRATVALGPTEWTGTKLWRHLREDVLTEDQLRALLPVAGEHEGAGRRLSLNQFIEVVGLTGGQLVPGLENERLRTIDS